MMNCGSVVAAAVAAVVVVAVVDDDAIGFVVDAGDQLDADQLGEPDEDCGAGYDGYDDDDDARPEGDGLRSDLRLHLCHFRFD